MRFLIALTVVIALLIPFSQAIAEDGPARVREAAKRSTLDQAGTKPFHMKAVLAPSRDRDRDSDRTGEVEIWWASPTRYRREVRTPQFHQIEIVDGSRRWQKTEGGYFPEWLRETAVALIRPIPSLDETLNSVNDADVKRMAGSTYYQWSMMSSDGNVQKGMGASVALTDSTGLLFYAAGLDWGGLYRDYQKFHGQMVARTVTGGSPEVTAKVITLEDLDTASSALFDVNTPGSDGHPLQTVTIDELALRKHLLPSPPITWPAIGDGPFEGSLTTRVILDRDGNVREVGAIVSDNQALNAAARNFINGMRFAPFTNDGNPAQVVSRITMPFKTVRPQGKENFESARNCFERGRQAGFLAAGSKAPYTLRAEFETATAPGKVEKGQYEDTWASDGQWRREARIGNSRYLRARNGDTHYELAEGPSAPLLKLVLRLMEPIPAVDTFYEGDWHIERDNVSGTSAVRVLAGYVIPDGSFDENVRAFWFDDAGDLLKAHVSGLDVLRLDFQDYSGLKIARRIDVMKNGSLGMRIQVLDLSAATPASPKVFELKGHEWTRAFTGEVR